ncbi:MAG: tRNA lysidine(34) synthetase TilS [Kaistella sp.]
MLNLTTFQHNLDRICADFKNKKFLLAVSGGVDSMVLFHLFKNSQLQFQVAHVNYGLRGKHSDEDQNLVETICKKSQIPIHLYTVSSKDNQPENSIQLWARDLRYNFFKKIKKEENLDFMITAHHLNDDLETFIINLSKASGIKGLSGIPANDNSILRPLLQFSKEEIYQFAREMSIEFREDLSNQKNDYLRNNIRNEIVPKLLEVNENFLENFGKSLTYLNEAKNFLQEKILDLEKEMLSVQNDHIVIQKQAFFEQSPFVQFEILHKYGFKNEIEKMNFSETGKIFNSGKYTLLVEREILVLKKTTHEDVTEVETELILENSETKIFLPKKQEDEIGKLGDLNWKFDRSLLHFPLKISRTKGEYFFHPIGIIGKKKISKFFKDEKIPIFARQQIWILYDANDNVLGILPYRQDRRFASTKDSVHLITLGIER